MANKIIIKTWILSVCISAVLVVPWQKNRSIKDIERERQKQSWKVKVKPQIGWILDFRIFLSCVRERCYWDLHFFLLVFLHLLFCRDFCVWLLVIYHKCEAHVHCGRIMLMTFWFWWFVSWCRWLFLIWLATLTEINISIGNMWLTTFRKFFYWYFHCWCSEAV